VNGYHGIEPQSNWGGSSEREIPLHEINHGTVHWLDRYRGYYYHTNQRINLFRLTEVGAWLLSGAKDIGPFDEGSDEQK